MHISPTFETSQALSGLAWQRPLSAPALRRSLRAFVMLFAAAAPFPAHASSAAQWVIDFNDRVSAQLGSTAIAPGPRAARLAALLAADLDAEALGRLTLGRHWLGASPDERGHFVAALRAFLVRGLAGRLRGFGPRPIVVVTVRIESGSSTVVTECPGEGGGASSHVDWRVTPHGQGWRLSDVVVEDVSLAAVLATQFQAALEGTRDGLEPVLAMLRANGEG